MGFYPRIYPFILFISLLITSQSLSQVVFRSLPQYRIKDSEKIFFDITEFRDIIPLNGKWKVYKPDEDEPDKSFVNVPSIFNGEGEFIFEKDFVIPAFQMRNNLLKLVFFGLNYTADISVNGVIIYRHSGGEMPLMIDLPRDILSEDGNNVLNVHLYYELDSENTIPLKQRFLFPQNFGGILRDVFIHLRPNISLKEIFVERSLDLQRSEAEINLKAILENREFVTLTDSLVDPNKFEIKLSISPQNDSSVSASTTTEYNLKRNKESNVDLKLKLKNPVLWEPSNPFVYDLKIEIIRNKQVIDRTIRTIAFYSLVSERDSLFFNGEVFTINGTTYLPSFYNYGNLTSYSQMESDLQLIRETGFNAVRFAKGIPHPYYLKLCEDIGLLAFVELPVNAVPEGLAGDNNFITRSQNFLSNILKGYQNYSALAGMGLGSGYLNNLDSHISLLSSLSMYVKENSRLLTYASFASLDVTEIDSLDLYGLELINDPIPDFKEKIVELQNEIGIGKLFISEATYIVNIGQTDGYVNQYSFEAQAKYFEDLIDLSNEINLAGYFINSMFDYRGDFASLLAGFDDSNLYRVGLINEERETNRLAYNVVRSKLLNTEQVTIPIGSEKDDAPMVFIIFGLVLAILMGVLVNSGRKFREDATRALLRPYNFFADVRDQRIMSAYHSFFLGLITAVVSALLLANLLFYFRHSLLLENILLAFGSSAIITGVSFLSWHPFESLLWLSLLSLVMILVLTIIIKAAAMFVRTRVYVSSVFFTVVWSLLPLVILIPLGIVLYRLLHADIANIYIYAVLIIFTLWILYRLLKGIHVIFDVNAGSVYFYGIIFLLVVIGGFLFYYQVNYSVIDHLRLTLTQYGVIG